MPDASITDVGNGWYRLSATNTADTTASGFNFIVWAATDSSGSTYNTGGNAGRGVFQTFGFQSEEGSFPTSYIPTSGSQVTRNRDSAEMTGTNFSSWYRADEGSIFLQYIQEYVQASGNKAIFSFNPGVQGNQMTFLTDTTPRTIFYSTYNSTQQTSVAAGTTTLGETMKHCVGYELNNVSMAVNGGNVPTDTNAIVPTSADQANIGANSNSALTFTGHISKIAYYPVRLTNEELQRLTEE